MVLGFLSRKDLASCGEILKSSQTHAFKWIYCLQFDTHESSQITNSV